MQEFRWVALEHPHHDRSVDWFWGLGIGAIIVAGISIYFHDIVFAILVITAAIAIAIMSLRVPQEIEYAITDRKLHIGDREYRYNELESFYVSDHGHEHRLIFAPKHIWGTYIVIPLYDHDPDHVRGYLLRKLPEVHHDEPLLHIVAEKLGI